MSNGYGTVSHDPPAIGDECDVRQPERHQFRLRDLSRPGYAAIGLMPKGRKTIVTPHGQAYAPTRVRSDPALVKALARAFRWQRMLDEGRYASVTEMAAAERIERGYLGRILRLALLAPDLVEAVLNGRQGVELRLPSMLEGVPVVWGEQRGVALRDA
jgi:hypothetical protein